jgi:hypothetical protein
MGTSNQEWSEPAGEINPYAAPRLHYEPSTLAILPKERWPELELEVASVHRGWWRRRIVLAGSINARLEYDPCGNGERVYVNGQLIVTTPWWGPDLVVPHIEFFLETEEHLVPASIDVRASFWRLFQTTAFRLTVADRIVYQDSLSSRFHLSATGFNSRGEDEEDHKGE